jgi:hypothetical protein
MTNYKYQNTCIRIRLEIIISKCIQKIFSD